MTIIFVFATATIPSFANYAGGTIPVVVVVALFVTLIPTTIGALLSAIGIAGMDRLVRFNVLAMSGRAVEAAGDVDTLLLDKTGTITLGNRQATEFKPLRGVTEQELADAAQLASLADETPEGRSIVVLAKEKYGIRGRDLAELQAKFIPFTAQSRMSGVEVGASWARKGAVDVHSQASSVASQPVGRRRRDRCARSMRSPMPSRSPAARRSRLPRMAAARRRSPQGYRQGRHPRALRRAAPHGHPHHHDHRRQSDDGRRHRGRGRRRRFPRPGDAGGQAAPHPR